MPDPDRFVLAHGIEQVEQVLDDMLQYVLSVVMIDAGAAIPTQVRGDGTEPEAGETW
jgi:hypothetical protein